MADVTKKVLSAKLRATLTESEDDSDSEVRRISDRIPFNRNANNNNNVDRNDIGNKMTVRPLNKDKENSPKILRIKSRRHLEHNDSSDNIVVDRPVTPVKDCDQPEIPPAPLTPTTNLKMLFSAVSPEIRKMQDQKRQEESISDTPPLELEDSKDDIIFSSQESDSGKPGGSRKEKSLGLLCQKFLQRYPEYPKCHLEVCLDEVAKDLNVERRRIYDIVNVLESVEIVSRIAKNKYAWHGKTNLVTTLTKLKMLAEKEGFGDQIEKVKEQEFYKELNCHKDIEMLDKTFMQKDKSLGIMSQKFLMLFLISKPKTVNLDISAKILIGDPTVARNESSKFKTKIRRLYDIANILTSLNLIRKVHVTEIRGRKPAFRYIGPDVDTDTDVNVCCSDGIHRPTSRHSLLDCIRNKEIANLMAPNKYIPIKPALGGKKYKSEIFPPVPKSDVPKRFSRHASFDMICEAAEKERSKLYGRSSEPSSPVKKLNFNDVEDDEVPEKPVKKEPPVADSARKKIFVYNTGQISVCPSPSQKNTTKSTKPTERVVVRPTTGVPQGSSPTIIPLTQQQINAVLKSLNVPITRQKTSATLVDACTQSSPSFPKLQNEITDVEHRSASPEFNMAVQNETTPSTTTDYLRGLKRGLDRQDSSLEKRIKMALPTPPSTEEELTSSSDGSPDAEVSEINQRLPKRRTTIENGRPSPLRALHLAPEFKSNGKFKTISPPELPEDSDLATPLPEDSDSKRSIPLMKGGVQQLTVKMANHPQQFIQVPVMHIPKTALTDMERQHVVNMSRSSLIQSLPLNSLNANQPINFTVPMAFSPPLTPVNPTSSPSFFPHTIISTNSSAFNVSPPQPSFTQASAIQMLIPGAQPMKMDSTQFISQSASSNNTVYHNMG